MEVELDWKSSIIAKKKSVQIHLSN